MADKKKRRHLPPRGLPQAKPIIEKEDFGENTFAGALEAVKGVLESAEKISSVEKSPKPAPKKKN